MSLVVVPMLQAQTAGTGRPKLVLQITVDGLRADLLARQVDRFGDGGFRYLLDTGTVYTNAHYQHANTETIVGHATLATGAQPSVHGMTGNVWYDAATGELAYNIEDPAHSILPSRAEATTGDQVDPAQRLARTQGRSPASLLVETLGDRLTASTGGRARVFGVSGKDRSAVAMAGHMGKAFWYSAASGDFVTSTYYYDAYPDWVDTWNRERKSESYAGATWNLLHDTPDSYLLGHQDDRPYESDLRGYGRTFPHRFGEVDGGLLFTQLVSSPVGDQLLADFAKQLIMNEQLGGDDVPDYLSVSFSGVDAVHHFFGPASLEAEDAVLQLDRTIADFLEFVDQAVGLEHTIIALSADHGAAELPEYMTELGYAAGRLLPETVISAADRVARAQFGLESIVRFYYRPYLYIDRDRIVEAGLDPDAVTEQLATAITAVPGIELAITSRGLATGIDSKLLGQIRNSFNAARAGDIYVVQRPYWFNFDPGPVVGMHGSPWTYDTHVPVIFAGMHIPSDVVRRPIQPADIAPTLAALLGMSPPSAAQGEALGEVLR